jgi:hypothetical protein
MYLQMQVHTLCWVNFAAGVPGALSFRGSLRGRCRASSTATDATPAGKLVEQYYRTAVAIFKVGGPWLGRTLLHPRVDLVFHYAQVEMQCRLGTSLTRNASAGNDGSGPADPRATMATRKKRLLRRLEWFWTDRLPNLVNRLRSLHRQAMRADRLK